MKSKILALLVALMLILACAAPAIAATTAEFTVSATGEYIAITDNVSSYGFGTHAASATENTSVTYVGITNSSSVQTDMTIAVTDNWTSGGTGWTHDNSGTPGANTAAMYAKRGPGTWNGTEIVIETLAGTPNYIYENCPASTNFTYGISLQYPTSFVDAEENTNTVRVTAAAG